MDLLKKLNVNNDDLKFKVTFDILINLNSDKTYKNRFISPSIMDFYALS